MILINAKALESPDNTIHVIWDYESGYLDNENHYVVEIAMAGTPSGPFTLLKVVPYTTTLYVYNIQPQGIQSFFFQVRLLNIRTGVVESQVLVPIHRDHNLVVEKLRRKKHILFTKKIKNESWVFKRKRIGYHCRKCWSPFEELVIQDNCPVCFETGFGNDSVTGLSLLKLDGLLKLNTNGYLEFYKRNSTFNYYHFETDHALVSVGDEFRVESAIGTVLLTAKITAVNTDTVVLDSRDETITNYIDNCKYAIYRQRPTNINNYSLTASFLFLGDTAVSYSLPENATGFKYGDTMFTIAGNTVTGDLSKLLVYEDKFVFLNGDAVLAITPNAGVLVIDQGLYKFILKESPDNAGYVYYYYTFDGVAQIKFNNKYKRVTSPGTSQNLTALFKVTPGSNLTCELSTLSAYEFIDFQSDEHMKFLLEHVFATPKISIVYLDYCKALNQLQYYVDEPVEIQLPHKHIEKSVFRGCGVLAINLLTGETFRGQNWDGEKYTESGDFFVNPETGELRTDGLPKGNYEFKYVYTLKDIVFESKFTPINGGFKDGVLKTVDYWTLQHPSLIGKSLDKKKVVVAIGHGKEYQEYYIHEFYPDAGRCVLYHPDNDPTVIWSALQPNTEISFDYQATGGYYNKQETYINYLSGRTRNEILTRIGLDKEDSMTIEVLGNVALETGDVIYNIGLQEFFKTLNMSERVFKTNELSHVTHIDCVPYFTKKMLFKLLER